MEWLKMFSIYAAIISAGVAIMLGIYNNHQTKRWREEDRREVKKNKEKAESIRMEDRAQAQHDRQEDQSKAQAMWKQQEHFNKSLAPLNVEVQLNQINNPNGLNEFKTLSLRDSEGKLISSEKMDFLKFFVNSGWISRIYVIDACFKEDNKPYIDMTKYYNNAQNFGNHLQKHSAEESLLWIEEMDNRIRIFCKNQINFYPEINSDIFYQFYLVESGNKKCQLFMYGKDCVDGYLRPFVMDRRGIASTVNTINNTFREEYIHLSNYLKKYGYNIT